MRRRYPDGSPADPEPSPSGVAHLDPSVTLTGDLAVAFEEFRAAAADLEGRFKAHQDAEQRYRKALAQFSRLSTGQKLEGPL